MRILFVTHSFPRSRDDTAGAFVHRLAHALQVDGDEVRVLAPSAPSLIPEADIDGVLTQRYRYAPRAWETLAYSGNMAEQARSSLRGEIALAGMLAFGALAVGRAVRRWKPDVVHAHWWFPAGLQCAWTTGSTPLVVTSHGSDIRLAATRPASHAVFRAVVNRAAQFTAVSTWLSEQAAAMAPGRHALVAPMPADVSLFIPGAERHAARILFVGRLNAQKGVAKLIDALAASRSNASLDVIGDGDDRAALERRAADAGIAHRVTFHGALPQRALVPFYRGATALVVPSEAEGLGLVAVEAQLCETPVIAFNSGGLSDVITDGVSGVLVPPGDIVALAAAIDAIVHDPARAAALGREGREQALTTFSPEAAARAYRAIYQNAVRHVG